MERSVAALAVCLWLMACEADHPCDKGQTYKQGSCMPGSETDAGASTKKDAASEPKQDASASTDSGSGGGTQCSEDQAKELGKSCVNNDGCNCAAPYCAVMPGSAMGFCTVYCKPTPDDCPSGYRCFDLSGLGVQGVEPFCIAK